MRANQFQQPPEEDALNSKVSPIEPEEMAIRLRSQLRYQTEVSRMGSNFAQAMQYEMENLEVQLSRKEKAFGELANAVADLQNRYKLHGQGPEEWLENLYARIHDVTTIQENLHMWMESMPGQGISIAQCADVAQAGLDACNRVLIKGEANPIQSFPEAGDVETWIKQYHERPKDQQTETLYWCPACQCHVAPEDLEFTSPPIHWNISQQRGCQGEVWVRKPHPGYRLLDDGERIEDGDKSEWKDGNLIEVKREIGSSFKYKSSMPYRYFRPLANDGKADLEQRLKIPLGPLSPNGNQEASIKIEQAMKPEAELDHYYCPACRKPVNGIEVIRDCHKPELCAGTKSYPYGVVLRKQHHGYRLLKPEEPLMQGDMIEQGIRSMLSELHAKVIKAGLDREVWRCFRPVVSEELRDYWFCTQCLEEVPANEIAPMPERPYSGDRKHDKCNGLGCVVHRIPHAGYRLVRDIEPISPGDTVERADGILQVINDHTMIQRGRWRCFRPIGSADHPGWRQIEENEDLQPGDRGEHTGTGQLVELPLDHTRICGYRYFRPTIKTD